MPIKLVPDSNVFMKLLFDEVDSDEARVLFKTCALSQTHLLVPELFKYEIAEVTRYFKASLAKSLTLFDAHEQTIMRVIPPTKDMWLLAEEISLLGHQQSGYPSIYDSIYHAIAIKEKAIFITADKRHYHKSKSFGNIQLLENWEKVFVD